MLYGYFFIVYIKANDVYRDIAEDAEIRFHTSNYELECNSINGTWPKRKKKKVIGLMKDELVGKIMTKFVGLRTKSYSDLIDDGSEDKKAKCTKTKLKFENYKSCLQATQLENKINHREEK